MTSGLPSRLHLARIEHLRFFAVLLIFVWHAYHRVLPTSDVPRVFLLSIFEEGHTGLSLSLVLSGFILATLCTGYEVAYGAFVRNRLLRVAPLLAMWTLFYFYTGSIPAERLLATILGLLNSNGSFPGIGWSVLVLFQLYLIFPFLLGFARRQGQRYLIGLLVTLLALRVGFYFNGDNIQVLSYNTALGRIDQFLLGILGFQVHRRWGRQLGHPLLFAVATLAWLALFHGFNVLGGYYAPTQPSVWIYLPTLEGGFYTLITVSYINLRVHLPGFVRRPAASLGAALGRLSYSLFLNHYPVIGIVFGLAAKLGLVQPTLRSFFVVGFGMAFPASLLLSAMTYTFIERPFLGLRGDYLRPSPETEGPVAAR
jgi:peptidoglycan/LPS O-acetylase OafA/YrhL